ncbi:RNA-directed DNA polymerase from mobile element jockey [Elysia marginata]|uniref:RNA-directed DNA polymerase from mobile element jockey n=1 Tax=Elysia marginata TaxID=1093978 RepID=A0AAV4JY10_9GAST|nr:RNA-directed DNA polymerase from mobile element jockey [Elysia marginata]
MKESVPQGSAISPTMFLSNHPNVKHTLHADDFAIWSSADYASTAKVRIQEIMNNVFKWIKDWVLSINPNKTVATKFSLRIKKRDVTLTVDDQPVPTEEATTFFGVTLEERLMWKLHIRKINQKTIGRSLIV